MDETAGVDCVVCLSGNCSLAKRVETALADGHTADVLRANTSEEGLRAVADHDVDCVVADYELPEGDGIEFLETLRADHPELPVILRTDGGSERIASRAISADVSEYMQADRVDDEPAELATKITELTEAYRSGTDRDRDLERTADLFTKTERIADVGGWEIDTETREVFWSDHLFDIFGIEADEEPPLDGALDIYHEADREMVAETVDTALDDGEPFDIETRFRRPDGEVRWLRIQGVPVVEDGRVETLRGAVQDITERYSREQALRKMHDIISDRDHSFDEQVRLLLELGRAELGTSYGTLSKIEGDDYTFEVVVADDDSLQEGDIVPVSATNCELAASTQETLVISNVERDAPDQTQRTGFTEWGIACYLGAPVFVETEVYGTFCFYDTEPRADQFSEWETTLVDLMSRWVSYELQRRQVTEQLHEQNEQLERFASIVSHDLRNPLSIIEGYVDMAIETGDVAHLAPAKSAINRMDTLIDDVLLLSRADRELELQAVDLRLLAERCWQTVPTDTATYTIQTNQVVQADETRLQQLLENLFRNAVEHGGDSVTVTIGDLEDGFYFEDNGFGIPAADRKTVFEGGYSTTTDGTGLGLSIVEEIVEAHGWDVQITESTEGGARFEITGVHETND